MTDLVPLLGSGGVAAAGLALLLRVLPGVVVRLSSAIATGIQRIAEAVAKAREKRADAEHERARAEHVEAEVQAMRELTLAGLLQEMKELREAVAACEKKHDEAQQTIDDLQSQIEELRQHMERRRITPPRGVPKAGGQ